MGLIKRNKLVVLDRKERQVNNLAERVEELERKLSSYQILEKQFADVRELFFMDKAKSIIETNEARARARNRAEARNRARAPRLALTPIDIEARERELLQKIIEVRKKDDAVHKAEAAALGKLAMERKIKRMADKQEKRRAEIAAQAAAAAAAVPEVRVDIKP